MTSPCLVLLRGAAKRRRKCQGEFVALDPIVAARTVDDDMGGEFNTQTWTRRRTPLGNSIRGMKYTRCRRLARGAITFHE